ncbi:unnamed protein product [Discula destructiva]
MHFYYAPLAAAVLSGAVLAAPHQARVDAVSMMAAVPAWTITSLSRSCDAADTKCTWSFGVNNGTGITPCTEVVVGTPASQTNGGPATCGVYTVTSGWSGQFGPGNGFTTFAVVNYAANLIAYPGYTDAEVAGGNAVTPDKSYAPQARI